MTMELRFVKRKVRAPSDDPAANERVEDQDGHLYWTKTVRILQSRTQLDCVNPVTLEIELSGYMNQWQDVPEVDEE